MSNKIAHDHNGRKVFSDSIVFDSTANEYFIPVCRNGIWGDEFLDGFYPLNPREIELVKRHATNEDLRQLMCENTTDAVFNVKKSDANE